MKSQVVTPELRQWILEQAKAGCRPEDVLASMNASGWDPAVAEHALEETLSQFLAERAQQAALPPAVPVPGPLLDGAPSRIWAGDREVKVLLTLHNPRVVLFGGLLSDDECDELAAAASPRMSRSETVVNATGGSEVHGSRTSRGMFFGRGESPLCERIEQRIATLLRWPVINGEGLQVLHYAPGAEYKPHYDYFDPAQPGMATVLKRGGQRVGTIIMY
ncbi:2-oxoglutarate-dependent dioxygenase, partial [Aquabacterium sp.]|uniref:2-oxoglutarate-dependent dioxygenase n=1 Tax=Aquabacterium sp. TaxID=1872578 RepID=UPI002BEDF2CA